MIVINRIILNVMLLFFTLASNVQEIPVNTLTRIAEQIYSLPQYAKYQKKTGEPEIIEKETIHLSQDKMNKIPKSSCFYGAKPGAKYYIVRYLYDMDVYSFNEIYCLEVYIWTNSQRVFAVKNGDSYMTKVNIGGNGKPDYDDTLVSYPADF